MVRWSRCRTVRSVGLWCLRRMGKKKLEKDAKGEVVRDTAERALVGVGVAGSRRRGCSKIRG